jgi:hypothetical protein
MLNIAVQSIESGLTPVVYMKSLTQYKGKVGDALKLNGTNNFGSKPAVWTIEAGKATQVK